MPRTASSSSMAVTHLEVPWCRSGDLTSLPIAIISNQIISRLNKINTKNFTNYYMYTRSWLSIKSIHIAFTSDLVFLVPTCSCFIMINGVMK